jgi:serine protease Do
MLWTVRSGEIASVGSWPQDMIETLMARLTATGTARGELAMALASVPKRRVLISSCGVNPGDSGGPLVNADGELVGVTFAIPRNTEPGISLDKFSYHVHIDEVMDFVKGWPTKPILNVPDPWPPATVSALADQDGDATADTLVFGMGPQCPFTGYQLDLDGSTPKEFKTEDLLNPEGRAAWDFEFAFQSTPEARAFYDTDNDGEIDVILIDTSGDDAADVTLMRATGGWKTASTSRSPILNPSLFDDSSLGRRLVEMMTK